MSVGRFRREVDYGAAISIAKNLLRRELITQAEFQKVKAELVKKYRPAAEILQTKTVTTQKGGKEQSKAS